MKNPEASTPAGVGLASRQKVDYPPQLQDQFHGRRFLPATPELLNYEGVEVLLIGSTEDPQSELGVELHPKPESEWTGGVFRDLRMEKSEHPVEPLFTGKWR